MHILVRHEVMLPQGNSSELVHIGTGGLAFRMGMAQQTPINIKENRYCIASARRTRTRVEPGGPVGSSGLLYRRPAEGADSRHPSQR
jgi:hypothetical protein